MNKNCARAEVLAGAVALGEATDHERDEYRRHVAACASCLRELGGEREIERVMETISQARASEVWDPVPLRAGERRARKVRFAWSMGASAAALAVLASLGIHSLIAANARPVMLADATAASPQSAFHVTLERRAHLPAPAIKPKSSQPGIVVVHNVITLNQNDKPGQKAPVHTTETVVAKAPAVEATPAVVARADSSNVPVWRRNGALPQTTRSAASTTTVARADTAPVLGGHAESIVVAPSYIVHDVVPLGGDTAINPRPAPIAYAMGAEGTTAFEVTVDERGVPVKCTITKPSGYLVLDNAVCKAAMQARYSPRTVNGRPMQGVYRDAFTFRYTPQDGDL